MKLSSLSEYGEDLSSLVEYGKVWLAVDLSWQMSLSCTSLHGEVCMSLLA